MELNARCSQSGTFESSDLEQWNAVAVESGAKLYCLMLYDERPWGSFTVLDEGANYKVKRIEVLPEKRLSYQRHEQRSEHWMVVAGAAKVTLDGREITLSTGDTIDIPLRAAHRIENVGSGKLVFIEIQQGTYLGEDDIQRLQDDYGRTK
jgi:mannose-6-phosphate isomerase